jgi:DNA-binding NarL/FixJ family response regulator
MIRIVLCDDHPVVLSGLEGVFRTTTDIQIVAACFGGAEALTVVREHRPDVLVIDLRMGAMSGLDVARILRKEESTTKVVIISGELSDEETLEALRTGVKGILLKEMAPEQIVECVRSVRAGRSWMEPRASGRAIEQLIRQQASARELSRTLTAREVELARLVGQGLRNKDIANRLDIGEGTVKAHLHNVYKKLGIETRVELVLLARDKGLA